MSRSVLAVLALVAVSGCDFLTSFRGSRPAGGTDMARVEAQIQALTQPPTATRAASCRAVAYGEKACGGPSRAVIFSTEKTDTARLRSLTDRFTALQDAENRRTGAVSDCMMLLTPVVELRGGVCAAKP